MTTPQAPGLLIKGRVAHKTSNALKIEFSAGPDAPLAVGVQGAGDGRGAKAAILFGFKNGGTGQHVITFTDGTRMGVHSRDKQPTLLSRDGRDFATVERGETSTAVDSAGRPIARFGPDPVEDRTPDVFRLAVTAADGSALADLTVIRKVAGWSLMRSIDALEDTFIWWDRAGQALKTPLLGTRLVLSRQPTAVERDVLLGACADITLGLRPYIASMN
jgi:hypothetical protein